MSGFKGTRAAVTGAAGFLGGAIASALAGDGAEVIGIDVASTGDRRRAQGVEPRIADVTDRSALERALDGVDLVVHAAAHVREWGSMEEFVRVNVGGTAAVMDAAEAVGCERVVQLSSVVVYGYDDPAEQDETAFRRTYGVPYIDTKSASDRLAIRRGAVVVRPGDVYGPGSIPWVVRPLEIARSSRLAVPSGGRGLMLPCYVDDLAGAVLAAAERGRPGASYTAWEGVTVTFGEYFDRIAEIAGSRPAARLPRAVLGALGGALEAWARLRGEPPMLSSSSALFIDRRGTASIDATRSELGWEPAVTLDEGMRRTADWARAEGLAG